MCNPSTQEIDQGRSEVQGQFMSYRRPYLQKERREKGRKEEGREGDRRERKGKGRGGKEKEHN